MQKAKRNKDALEKRQKKILVIVVAIILFMIIVIEVFRSEEGLTKLDTKSYKSVAEHFVKKNVYIARRLGKIQRVSHVGKGGGSGKKSHNVFRLVGTNKKGVCELTLTKDEKEKWSVESALLTMDGMEYKIPIRGSVGSKLRKIF